MQAVRQTLVHIQRLWHLYEDVSLVLATSSAGAVTVPVLRSTRKYMPAVNLHTRVSSSGISAVYKQRFEWHWVCKPSGAATPKLVALKPCETK